MTAALASGQLTPAGYRAAQKAEGWYPTPASVVAHILDLAQLEPGMTVLEPSAGLGAIAGPAASRGAVVDCVENHPGRAAELAGLGIARDVRTADFLTAEPDGPGYDRVLMNPPFAGHADTRHVLHALRFVKPGGRLVAVMGGGVAWRSDAASRKIRELTAPRPGGGRMIGLPSSAFAEAFAGLQTVLVVIPVPDGTPVDPDEPPVEGTSEVPAQPFTVRVNNDREVLVTAGEPFWCGDEPYVPVDCRDLARGIESQSIEPARTASSPVLLLASRQTRDCLASVYLSATTRWATTEQARAGAPSILRSGVLLPDDFRADIL